jgi:hypothetical protein
MAIRKRKRLAKQARRGPGEGKTVGIDATTLGANAALRSILRRDAGEGYQDFSTKLAQASGIETPPRADLARIDRKAYLTELLQMYLIGSVIEYKCIKS